MHCLHSPLNPDPIIFAVHPLEIEKGRLITGLSPGPWIIDTGSPVSFGNAPVGTGHREHSVPKSYLGLTTRTLAEHTGISCFGLIGCDILNGYACIFDLPNGILTISIELPKHPRGAPVKLGFVGSRSAPYLDAKTADCRNHRLIFDTGSQYSYLDNLENLGAIRVEERVDLLLAGRRFKVDLHEVTVTVGSITKPLTFATEPGKPTCPAPVAKLLKTTGTGGILGWEILRHGPVAYLPQRGELWI